MCLARSCLRSGLKNGVIEKWPPGPPAWEVTENPTFGEFRQRKKISLQVRLALYRRGDDDLVVSVSVRAPFQLILLLACAASASAELQSSALPPSGQRADAMSQARITGHVVLGDTQE